MYDQLLLCRTVSGTVINSPSFPKDSLQSDVLLPDGSSANLIDFLVLHFAKGNCCFLFFESCGVRGIFGDSAKATHGSVRVYHMMLLSESR